MNAFTGTVFAVIIAFGWLMVIWWVIIMLLGVDIRKNIRNMGGKTPELKITSIIVTSLLHLMTVAVTLGYFYETTYLFYVNNQLVITLGGAVAVAFACFNNDNLHRQLMINIGCYEKARRNMEKIINNDIENVKE